MMISRSFLVEYARAVHPEDYTKQHDLVAKLVTGRVTMPKLPEMVARIWEFQTNYEEIERWWEKFWDEVGDATWKRPWLIQMFANGTKCYDHNPTFSCLSSCGRYAFRVLHLHEGEFAYWTDDVQDQDEEVTVRMLTICSPKSMASQAQEVIKKWIANGYEIEPQPT